MGNEEKGKIATQIEFVLLQTSHFVKQKNKEIQNVQILSTAHHVLTSHNKDC